MECALQSERRKGAISLKLKVYFLIPRLVFVVHGMPVQCGFLKVLMQVWWPPCFVPTIKCAKISVDATMFCASHHVC
jgi:hypothetical protein